ncbi:MAG: twin-arginine translocation signal domain-containing protein, partial [Acidobacteria bacterium]|nr:twin-arginine translocation signal domain-containing protein [Acidobacteriota bacterium]
MSDFNRRKFLKGVALAGAAAAFPAPAAAQTFSFRGRVVYPGPEGAGVAGASVEIVDLDTGGDGNDLIWSTTTDAEGGFGGFLAGWNDAGTSRDAASLYGSSFPADPEVTDVPLYKAVIRQGAYVQEFPLPSLMEGENTIPPLVVRWVPKVTVSLPQLDTPFRAPGECAQSMELKQTYQWDHSSLPPLAFCQGVPAQENPPLGFLPGRIQVAARGSANSFIVKQIFSGQPFGGSLEDYKDQYKVLPQPEVIPTYKDDQEFASQRLTGINPVMLKRVSELPADFPVTDEHLRPFFPRPNPLRTALTENRLLMLDYDILADVTRWDGKRYLPAPYALFLASDDRSQLIPVAIQIERGHDAASNPVYTPMSPQAHWYRAKLMVQVADGSAHEIQFHLYNGHFAMEPVAVAMARNLCVNHPLKLLLMRHFQIMIWNNDLGRKTLINPGGPVDTLLGTGLAGSLVVIKEAHDRWRFDQAGLLADLALRGVNDPSQSITDYPYRDDALLIWAAIRNFVKEYVGIYGYNDQAV